VKYLAAQNFTEEKGRHTFIWSIAARLKPIVSLHSWGQRYDVDQIAAKMLVKFQPKQNYLYSTVKNILQFCQQGSCSWRSS